MACCKNRDFFEGYYPGYGNGYYPGYGNDYYYGAPCEYGGYNGCNGYYPERCYPRPRQQHDDIVVDIHLKVPEHHQWY